MTLLDQARKTARAPRAALHPQGELLEMALATLKGEITVSQAQRVMYPNKSSSGFHQLTSARLWRAVMLAVQYGELRIVLDRGKREK